MSIIQRIWNSLKRRLRGQSKEEANHQWLLAHGLQEGEHVDCFSWNGIDAQYPGLITIGDYVTIASDAKILAHDASMGYLTRATKIGVVEIGNHVFIGARAVVLPNVRIGDWSIIGAGSVVNKDVPPGQVWAGIPAKFICATEQMKQKHEAGLLEKPVSFKPWRDWANATPDEWSQLRTDLHSSFGYVTQRDDIRRNRQ